MKREFRQSRWAGFVAAIGILTITACAAPTAGKSENRVQEIIVGTGIAYEPYCYLDENGELAGYEKSVLEEVNKRLLQYHFKYQTSDFNGVLISLDTGKIDIAAHQYEKNADREKKYLFGTVPYTTYVTYITVPADREDIHSIDDLRGKTVWGSSAGSNTSYILEGYNEGHKDNPIDIRNGDSITDEELIAGLLNGKMDATIMTKRDMERKNQAYGSEILKITGEPLQTSSTYFVFNKDNEELRNAVDKVLMQLKEEGILAEISLREIGGDYTESE